MSSVTISDAFRALVAGDHPAPLAPKPARAAPDGRQAFRFRQPGRRPLILVGEHLLSQQGEASGEADLTLRFDLFAEAGELILVLQVARAGGRPQVAHVARSRRAADLIDAVHAIDPLRLLPVPAELLDSGCTQTLLAAHEALGRRIEQIRADFAALCARALNPSAAPACSPL